jgi:hypothetical protein
MTVLWAESVIADEHALEDEIVADAGVMSVSSDGHACVMSVADEDEDEDEDVPGRSIPVTAAELGLGAMRRPGSAFRRELRIPMRCAVLSLRA